MKMLIKEALAKLLKRPMVVESGSSGIWAYRKWSDGTAECWGKYNANITSWSAWNNIYEGMPGFYLNYPSNLFIDNPTVEITVQSCSLGLIGIEHYAGGTKDRTGDIYFLRPATGPAGSYPIGLSAKGRWKI